MLTTIEIAKRFEKAKFTKPQSEVIATVIKEVVAQERGNFVTEKVFEARMDGLEHKMDKRMGELRSEMDRRFTEQDGKIDGLRSDMESGLKGLRGEMDKRFTQQDSKIDSIHADLDIKIMQANASQLRWIMGILTAQTALIVTIIFALIKYLQGG